MIYINLTLVGILMTVTCFGFLRFFHMPYEYTQSNVKKLNKIISNFRKKQQNKMDKYQKRQLQDLQSAQEELDVLETSLANRIERASQKYDDEVSEINKLNKIIRFMFFNLKIFSPRLFICSGFFRDYGAVN